MTEHHDPTQHLVPLPVYFAIFATLMVLTGVTVWVAFRDLGPLNTPIAMAIAGFKATIVALWFMHLKYSKRLTWVFAVGAVLWLTLMIVFTLADFWSRAWI